MPEISQIEVNPDHVFGLFYYNESAVTLYWDKQSKNEGPRPLSRSCGSNGAYEADLEFLFSFENVTLTLETRKPYRSPSIQPYIEESEPRGIGKLFLTNFLQRSGIFA